MGLSGPNSRRCMAFAGVSPPSVLRGRALSSVATSSSRAGECTERSAPLEVLAQQPVLVGPRCMASGVTEVDVHLRGQGDLGVLGQLATLVPVSDFHRCSGSVLMVASRLSRTTVALWLSGRCTGMTYRVCLSTRWRSPSGSSTRRWAHNQRTQFGRSGGCLSPSTVSIAEPATGTHRGCRWTPTTKSCLCRLPISLRDVWIDRPAVPVWWPMVEKAMGGPDQR